MSVLARRSTSSRIAIGLIDSSVSSVGNLAASVIAARSTSVHEFGVFATAMLVLILATTASKSIHGDPLVLKNWMDDTATGVLDAQRSTASVLRVTVIASVAACTAAVTLMLTGQVASRSLLLVILVSGTAVPLLCLQDHLRWIAYASGANHRALVNNVLWTTTSTAALAIAGMTTEGQLSAYTCVALWAYGTAPGIVYAISAGGVRLTGPFRSSWLTSNRGLIRPLFLDSILTQANAQGATLVIAALTGAADVALIRKGQILMGPATVATTGLLAALQPILTRKYQTGGHHLTARFAVAAGMAAAMLISSFGAAVYLLPPRYAEVLAGPGWEASRSFVGPLTAQAASGVLGGCLGIAIRASNQVRKQVRWRMVLAPASLVAVGAITRWQGAYGGLWSLALASAATALSWMALLRIVSRAGRG